MRISLYIYFILLILFAVNFTYADTNTGGFDEVLNKLESRYYTERNEGLNLLKKNAGKFENEIITAYENPSLTERTRTYLLESLFFVQTKRAASFLSVIYQNADEAKKEFMNGIIPSLKPKNLDVLYALLPESNLKSSLKAVEFNIRLEREIVKLIPKSNSMGSYEGQVSGIVALGDQIIPILFKIIEGKYTFLIKDSFEKENGYWVSSDYIWDLAVRALAEIPEKKDEIIEFFEDIIKKNSLASITNPGKLQEIYFSLYKLGKKKYIKQIEMELTVTDNKTTGPDIQKQLNLAYIYVNTGRGDKALSIFLKLLEYKNEMSDDELDKERLNNIWYNVACLYANVGKYNKAIEYMSKCLEGGYDEIDWIIFDGDLDPIRDKKEFILLLKKYFPEYDFKDKDKEKSKKNGIQEDL